MYRPERWLESSEEDLVRMKRSADLLFGSGRYQCLGRNLALLELRKVLSTVSFSVVSRGPELRAKVGRDIADFGDFGDDMLM